jgi:hypothetical protein
MAFVKDTSKKQLSDLTLEEVTRIQKPAPGYVLAVGKYQAVPETFKSWLKATKISLNTIFNAETQEKLGDWLITSKREKVGQYVNGDVSVTLEEAQLELAREFASIPVPYDITRPAGKGYPSRRVLKGQSYYFGIAGNNAQAPVERYQQALLEARRTRNLNSLKQFIARGEGGYDSLNRGRAGDTPTYSPEYYNALSRIPSSPSQTTPQTTTADILGNYLISTYVRPVSASYPGEDNSVVQNFLISLQGKNTTKISAPNNKTYKEWLGENTIYSNQQLAGELILLDSAAQVSLELAAESKENLSKIDGLIPAEAAFLVQNNLFELRPDVMRQQMMINAGSGINSNYSHAWRSPGKLAITADLTIPGAAGFKIGQIFWVGRTYEHYKQFGAFQLFGLTEEITINKGWTTTIHSRFNAMPIIKIVGLQSE